MTKSTVSACLRASLIRPWIKPEPLVTSLTMRGNRCRPRVQVAILCPAALLTRDRISEAAILRNDTPHQDDWQQLSSEQFHWNALLALDQQTIRDIGIFNSRSVFNNSCAYARRPLLTDVARLAETGRRGSQAGLGRQVGQEPFLILESVPGSCPNQAFRAHSVPICDRISLCVSERVSVSDRPSLPWHGRGREFESHQFHQPLQSRYR